MILNLFVYVSIKDVIMSKSRQIKEDKLDDHVVDSLEGRTILKWIVLNWWWSYIFPGQDMDQRQIIIYTVINLWVP